MIWPDDASSVRLRLLPCGRSRDRAGSRGAAAIARRRRLTGVPRAPAPPRVKRRPLREFAGTRRLHHRSARSAASSTSTRTRRPTFSAARWTTTSSRRRPPARQMGGGRLQNHVALTADRVGSRASTCRGVEGVRRDRAEPRRRGINRDRRRVDVAHARRSRPRRVVPHFDADHHVRHGHGALGRRVVDERGAVLPIRPRGLHGVRDAAPGHPHRAPRPPSRRWPSSRPRARKAAIGSWSPTRSSTWSA